MFRFQCPRCHAVLEAPERRGGTKTNCAKCNQRVQIPLMGFGPKPEGNSGESPVRFVQRALAWGAFDLATGETGDPDRALPANPAGANSSTMKGPQGLASEFCGRRCQTAKDFHRRVRGCFYVRSPEITINIVVQTMPARKSCAYDGGPSG